MLGKYEEGWREERGKARNLKKIDMVIMLSAFMSEVDIYSA